MPDGNGSSASRVELRLVKEVFEEAIAPLRPIPAQVATLTTEVAVMSERLDHVATPDNCPISHDVQALQVAVRDSSHEGNANTTFRIQTKAIFAFVVILLGIVSSTATILLDHLF